jgi:pimeloyl-ACP methyl ester carboxylesterase
MISRITKFLLALQLLAATGLFLAFQARGVALFPAFMLSGFAIILFRLLITANNFLLAWVYGSDTPTEHRIKFYRWVRLFFSEYKATILTSSWTMPFCSFAKYVAPNSNTLPVLLVHGYGCNSGQWNAISRQLKMVGITHFAIDMEPVFGNIESYVPIIERAIFRICNETSSSKVVVLAHSMGGLAAMAYLRNHGNTHVAKIITLGTPYHGTALAKFGKGINSRQMRRDVDAPKNTHSNWLSDLVKEQTESARECIVSIYSHHDNIIAPQISSHLPGARNIALHAIGHVALLFDATIQELVVQEIKSAHA